MQSHDRSRFRSPHPAPHPPLPPEPDREATTPVLPGLPPELPFAESRVVLAAPGKALIDFGFRRGTSGPNPFGPDPLGPSIGPV